MCSVQVAKIGIMLMVTLKFAGLLFGALPHLCANPLPSLHCAALLQDPALPCVSHSVPQIRFSAS